MLESRILAVIAAVSIGFGCSGTTTTCSGAISYDGQPVNGYITFSPTDGKGSVAGGPIRDGSYSVADLSPGSKSVKIEAVKKVNFASTSEEMQKKAEEERKRGRNDGLVDPADTIPANAEGNNATVELKPGENKKDFRLLKPAVKS